MNEVNSHKFLSVISSLTNDLGIWRISWVKIVGMWLYMLNDSFCTGCGKTQLCHTISVIAQVVVLGHFYCFFADV